MDYEKSIKNIRLATKDYLVKGNIKSVVLGVSGGIDSALVAALIKPVCADLNIPLIGRSISIVSNKVEEEERAMNIGIQFCKDFKEVDLTNLYEPISTEINFNIPHDHETKEDIVKWKIRNGNIKARLRMMYLYNLASMNDGLVLSTDNYTEYLLGFWTLHGDVGDYGMIQELWKTEVYEMSEWIAENECNHYEAKALIDCIEGVATDGLGITNSDLDQILPGFDGRSVDGYREVDKFLKQTTSIKLSERLAVDESQPVIQRHIKSEFKRNNPYNLKRKDIL